MSGTTGLSTTGSGKPEIVTRAEQPYLAIRAQVAMDGIAGFAARFGELFGMARLPRGRPGRPAVLPLQRHRHGRSTGHGSGSTSGHCD